MNSDEITEAEAVSTDESSHDLLMQKELWDDLERAIEALPKKQREVVECRRQGKSFQDIAHFQKSSVNTVLGRMHYAVKKLRDSLREHMV